MNQFFYIFLWILAVIIPLSVILLDLFPIKYWDDCSTIAWLALFFCLGVLARRMLDKINKSPH